MVKVAEELLSVFVEDYSIEICDKCAKEHNFMKYPHSIIEKPHYMTMCTICEALPPMVLGKCSDCGERNVHPYDQYHAEGWCSNE
jgi:hypothetical protein